MARPGTSARSCVIGLRIFLLYFRSFTETIGTLIMTYAIVGAPYYNYSTMGPETLF